jgi:hypothetical protein
LKISWDVKVEFFLSRIIRPVLRNAVSGKRISQEFFCMLGNSLDVPAAVHITSVSDLENIASKRLECEIRIAFVSDGDTEFGFTQDFDRYPRITFFVQNMLFRSGKNVLPLPIGVEGIQRARAGMPWNFWFTSPFESKLNKILVGPYGATHPERNELAQHKNSNFVTFLNHRVSSFRYSRLAQRYKFIACPRGNGRDTHRFWETLYRGGVPVVLEDEWSANLADLGVPLIQIRSWDHLEEVIPASSNVDWQAKLRDCRLIKAHNWKLFCQTWQYPANPVSFWLPEAN